jgi:chemotaxis protein methyltransferase CheR
VTGLIREIAQLIEATSGFVIGAQSSEALERLVNRRIERGGFAGVESYVDYLRRHPDSEEWRHILNKITNKESYLFRAHAQFEALSNILLSEVAERRSDGRLRVWCAGCARGEEAATLAIVLADHPVVGSWEWKVLATDVDEAALADARRGIYGSRAVGRVPAATLKRHFALREDGFELAAELRERIEFRRLNLVEQPLDLADGLFDVVFLRNVLIYFRPEIQRRVVETVEETLTPDGILFLGPSESLLHLGTRLQARDLGDCFCYRRPSRSKKSETTLKAAEPPSKTPSAEEGGLELPKRTPGRTDAEPPFGARLESMVGALTGGDNRRASAGLRTLRREFPESAATRALEGVALERSGDPEGAARSYRAALYLAPEMDEIRFLLAVALERLGRLNAAAREYRTALTGLGPAGGYMTEVLGRLGFPDHHQMSQKCREFLQTQ